MFNSPLYKSLVNHNNKDMSSFHMPGHKNFKDILPKNLIDFDITEIPDTDNLFEANGAILESEKNAAKLFDVKKTIFSAGGCTLCIQTMLRLCAPNGGKVIIGRNVHKSAVNAMALLDIEPVWVMPDFDSGDGLPGRISHEKIYDALKKNPDSKAVYITSPDYFGVISDVKAISNECKKFDVPLIVDNAHGAHLNYVSGNLHPSNLGAALTACSAHKTLPVLTGGAWLNINDEKFLNHAKDTMSIFASTSPSYLIMLSLDICINWLEKHGKTEFLKLEKKVSYIKKLAEDKGFLIPIGCCDPIRITLNTTSVGYTGIEVADMMRKNKIEPEYANNSHVVLIATPFNTEKDFFRLETFIKNFKTKPAFKIKYKFPEEKTKFLSLRQAFMSKSEYVNTSNAVGRIVCETFCPCPPGVPLFMPGEKLSFSDTQILLNCGISKIKVLK